MNGHRLGRMNTVVVLVAQLFQYTNFNEANAPTVNLTVKVKELVAQSCLTLCDPSTVWPRQEH